MKRILTLSTVLLLAVSINIATAQEKILGGVGIVLHRLQNPVIVKNLVAVSIIPASPA